MRRRKLGLGDRNIVGARVTEARTALGMKERDLMAKLQTEGVDIGQTAISQLEGQRRPVTDVELLTLARVLKVTPHWLLGWEEEIESEDQ